MSSYTSISPDKLSRLIGTPNVPTPIGVRINEDFGADPRLASGAMRLSHRNVQECAAGCTGRSILVICHKGEKPSGGMAAWRRHNGMAAETLERGWQKIDETFGRKPAVTGDVHRYGFPRIDLTVTLDGGDDQAGAGTRRLGRVQARAG